MPQGLQIWDEQGNLRFTTDTRISRYIGSWSGKIPANSYVDVSIPGFSLDGSWAIYQGNHPYANYQFIQTGIIRVRNLKLYLPTSYSFGVFRR